MLHLLLQLGKLHTKEQDETAIMAEFCKS
jgi:hypothetical protein